MEIRPVKLADAAALAEIYSPYVTETDVTFDTEIPTAELFEEKIRRITEFYPFIAAEEDGEVLGYAYAHEFRPRSAFVWSAETTVYVRRDRRGCGVGKALCLQLEKMLKGQGIINLYACITDTNAESIAFHERLGYKYIGCFENCGYKLGRWLGVVWLGKTVGGYDEPPAKVMRSGEPGKES